MHLLRYLYHQLVRAPRAERPLYRAIHRRRPRQLVQVGLGDGDQVERMLRFAGGGIKLQKFEKYNLISIEGQKDFKAFDLYVGGDFSSASFFILLY